MKYITIKDNKVIASRDGEEIVEGEVENSAGLEVGMELNEGKWQFPAYVPSYEEKRQEYIRLISDAQLLGETDEVTRLQEEWKTVKTAFTKTE